MRIVIRQNGILAVELQGRAAASFLAQAKGHLVQYHKSQTSEADIVYKTDMDASLKDPEHECKMFIWAGNTTISLFY